tara:strand:- start:235 stop:792 length:558 start_codon:yes stop_codon:yes gene_type:complete
MITPTLQTDRLTLRALQSSDAKGIQEYFPRWNIVKHLSDQIPWPYPVDGAKQFVEMSLKKEGWLIWAITLRGNEDGDECVGVIDYTAKDAGVGNRGFWLAEHLHGRGLMTEAIEAMQDYIFFELGVEKIRVGNSLQNPASRRLKEKTGGVYVGTGEFRHLGGCDEIELWDITQANWRQIRQKDRK